MFVSHAGSVKTCILSTLAAVSVVLQDRLKFSEEPVLDLHPPTCRSPALASSTAESRRRQEGPSALRKNPEQPRRALFWDRRL